MYDYIHEPITVIAEFRTPKPQVHRFTWQQREHVVKALNLVTKARKGRDLVWLFHVSTDTGAYKLRLDTDTLQWWLEELTWEVN